MAQRSRKFDGKMYILEYTGRFFNKTTAKKHAKGLRNKGWNARIVTIRAYNQYGKWGHTYGVYKRRK